MFVKLIPIDVEIRDSSTSFQTSFFALVQWSCHIEFAANIRQTANTASLAANGRQAKALRGMGMALAHHYNNRVLAGQPEGVENEHSDIPTAKYRYQATGSILYNK